MNEEYSMALEVSNPENYAPLLEYYQGKTKELLKCEGYLREIIKEVKDFNNQLNTNMVDTVLHKTHPITANNKWNKLLCEELRKMLKVKEVNIYWDDGEINACTYPPASIFIPQYKSAFLSGKEMNLKIHVFIYDNLITMANFNEQELLAFILHEIGHNFYYCPILIGSDIFFTIITFGIAPLVNFVLKTLRLAFAELDMIGKEMFPALYNALNVFNNFMTEYKLLSRLINMPKNLIGLASGKLVLKFPSTPMHALRDLSSYGNERGADSFAAMYGYGPDLASGLRKLKTVEDTIYGKVLSETGPIGSIYGDMIYLSSEIIGMMTLEEHPNSNQRASNLLNKLKRDLKNGDYPPNVKKDLENEIARMEKAYITVSRNASKSNVQVRQTWYKVIDKITAGNSDFREIFKFYFDSFTF